MPSRIRNIFKNTKTSILGVLDEEERNITCAKYVNKNMQQAVSKLYINNHFDSVARKEV
jgi:hypothetical protein